MFRRPPHPNLASRVDEILQQGSAATNGLIKLEIISGARNDKESEDYSQALNALSQLTIDDRTWAEAARLGYRLRRQGLTVHSPDLIVAASAMEHGAILVHADADFDRIAANSRLRVESFAEANG